ncbi:hypothetical protein Tco_0495718 [Tanacetum coccineum]
MPLSVCRKDLRQLYLTSSRTMNVRFSFPLLLLLPVLEQKISTNKNNSFIVDSPFIYPLELDNEQLRNWDMFKLQVKDVKVVRGLRYRLSGDAGGDFGEDIEPHADICISLAKFAIDTFNKSYQHVGLHSFLLLSILTTVSLTTFTYM